MVLVLNDKVLVLNDKVVFYKTDEQLDKEKAVKEKAYEDKKIADFEKNREKVDWQYNNLPKCFKERIDKKRSEDPKFRFNSERYEIFCYEQAIAIANGCNTRNQVLAFKEMDWNSQLDKVPLFSEDQSQDTLTYSLELAILYLESPDKILNFTFVKNGKGFDFG